MRSDLIMVVDDDEDLRHLYVQALKTERIQSSIVFKHQRSLRRN